MIRTKDIFDRRAKIIPDIKLLLRIIINTWRKYMHKYDMYSEVRIRIGISEVNKCFGGEFSSLDDN